MIEEELWRPVKEWQCNYPNCDGGPQTGYCHKNCRGKIAMDELIWRPYNSDPACRPNPAYIDSSGNLVIDEFSSKTNKSGVREKIRTVVLEKCKYDT
jgi:hypothetical protein